MGMIWVRFMANVILVLTPRAKPDYIWGWRSLITKIEPRLRLGQLCVRAFMRACVGGGLLSMCGTQFWILPIFRLRFGMMNKMFDLYKIENDKPIGIFNQMKLRRNELASIMIYTSAGYHAESIKFRTGIENAIYGYSCGLLLCA